MTPGTYPEPLYLVITQGEFGPVLTTCTKDEVVALTGKPVSQERPEPGDTINLFDPEEFKHDHMLIIKGKVVTPKVVLE